MQQFNILLKKKQTNKQKTQHFHVAVNVHELMTEYVFCITMHSVLV